MLVKCLDHLIFNGVFILAEQIILFPVSLEKAMGDFSQDYI